MDEEKNSPMKSNSKNNKNKIDLISNNKRLILESKKPFNNIQLSSQYRVCNKKSINNKNDEDEKNSKQKISIINNINIFRLNSASKNNNIVSLSQEKTKKNIKEHQDNQKKIKELEKLLEELNKNKNDLSNEIDKLNNEENKLQNDLNKKEDEEKGLNEELEELKNINEDKNREYLNLCQLNQQRMNDRNNNQIRRDNNNNINGEHESMSDILNSFLRFRDQINNQNNENNEGEVEGGGGQNNINPGESSINESNFEIGEDEDLGPPMNLNQIDGLPAGKYPKKEKYEEKCVLCGFTFCYNDSINILDKCKHTFHKECLGNFLINRSASKCPVCKVSIIE